ncbi:Pyruvate kinase PKLR [Thelohanellus kitauei]|uniref:Pyruvate kinase n=1 Tax=Thelohanellus kitauei TaxID=669202 RepID=A0A0C2NJ98_THEKT|nr:Pyruvate kinase PKLR [Thelohanellus kitauei]
MEMIKAGMCIARFNFSHGTHADHKKMFQLVREASKQSSEVHQLALALDTKGPEIRTGLNKGGENITLVTGTTIIVTTDDAYKETCTAETLYIDYKSLVQSVDAKQTILIADGSVVLEVKELRTVDVICDVICGSTFGSRKNVCLPKVRVNLPAMSEKDIKDIELGMEEKLDIIFASFVRSADNVRELRKLLNTTEHGKKMKIVSKIENFEGVENIEEIVQLSDGIMVARGDLGMDLDAEKVIIAQKKIMAECNVQGKPVICATQMLESMIEKYRPTRAEISDVMNSVLDGTDCVMLSGESANGKYPVQAVKTLHDICHAAEKMYRTKRMFEAVKHSFNSMSAEQATAVAAVEISYNLHLDGIIVLTTTGKTAQIVSQFRPRCLIFALTRSAEVARSLHLYRNVCPLFYSAPPVKPWIDDIEARIKFSVEYAVKYGVFRPGSPVAIVTGWKSGPGFSNSLRVGYVKADFTIEGLR